MTTPATHTATLLPALAQDLVLEQRQTPSPGPGELLIRNHAIAMNPVDWKRQMWGFKVSSYPVVLGADICGIVAEVGSAVATFKPGDRIFSLAHAFCSGNNDHGAFQEYTVVNAASTALLPTDISFQKGSTLPTAVGTATMALFDVLNLPRPPIEENKHAQVESSPSSILVWGGASSAGSMTIQMARLAGFTVFAAASERHHDYLRSLGASVLVDYHSSTAAEDLIAAAEHTGTEISYAVDTISASHTLGPVVQVLSKSTGVNKKIAHTTGWPADLSKPDDIGNQWIAADELRGRRNDLSVWLFNEALPKWLERGAIVPTGCRVMKGGLGGVQNALNELKNGVSGEKLVVEI
ncbi:hypothetical protein QQX98_003415 [Neonectria punicea]|uniref:Enoyl reductase (ER) domain-containing protein n=1 Tax=Neonectria punicea TaxID=979145 RepID=A0ABR1HDM7_9HYPO